MEPIKLTEDQIENITDCFSEIKSYNETILFLSRSVQDVEKNMWDKIFKWYPNIENESIKIDYKTGVISNM